MKRMFDKEDFQEFVTDWSGMDEVVDGSRSINPYFLNMLTMGQFYFTWEVSMDDLNVFVEEINKEGGDIAIENNVCKFSIEDLDMDFILLGVEGKTDREVEREGFLKHFEDILKPLKGMDKLKRLEP